MFHFADPNKSFFFFYLIDPACTYGKFNEWRRKIIVNEFIAIFCTSDKYTCKIHDSQWMCDWKNNGIWKAINSYCPTLPHIINLARSTEKKETVLALLVSKSNYCWIKILQPKRKRLWYNSNSFKKDNGGSVDRNALETGCWTLKSMWQNRCFPAKAHTRKGLVHSNPDHTSPKFT